MSYQFNGETVDSQSLVCHTWFERDRKNIRLETADGVEIFCLWDADVDDAIESGYLDTPRRPRPSDDDWLPCAINYATSTGMLMDGAPAPAENHLPTFEVTAAGFDGSTDETDDRVFWVKAESAAVVKDATDGTGAVFQRMTDVVPARDIDFHLPSDHHALRGRLLVFEQMAATSSRQDCPRGA